MIRRATPEDAQTLRRVEAAALPPGWTKDQIQGTLDEARSLVLIAEEQDEPQGYVSFRSVLDEAELLRLGVVPNSRRRGIASALLGTAATQLAESGVRDLFLEVRADNFPALAFYASLGWKATGSRPNYYPGGVDAVLMRCPARALTSSTL
ncbi:MAG: ribosomal protein S18-alanine N-acetyltransferase [Thermoanaerobaculia bacterium]|nr:ribosomal protein S18-alanine N-acetyltransferase [Thermoanaerobaculia bacterium]